MKECNTQEPQTAYEQTKGFIHSFQSLGTVDGPGVRFVVFVQGCPLRCVYCHNPDTWAFVGKHTEGAFTEKQTEQAATKNAKSATSAKIHHLDPSLPLPVPTEAKQFTAQEVVQKILRFRPYIKQGGVTVSGGEALSQPEFVEALFYLLQKEDIHTALDTSCIGNLQKAQQVLRFTNLVIADLKFCTPQDYRTFCGANMEDVLQFLSLTEQMRIPLWIRHVVVPGLNDNPDRIRKISEIAHRYRNLEKLELLPFRKLCVTKYEAMGIDFPLQDYEECSQEEIQELEKMLAELEK